MAMPLIVLSYGTWVVLVPKTSTMTPLLTRSKKELRAENRIQQGLIFCGILSSLLYVAMNVLVAMEYKGYNAMSQAVSELSAIGAPTRTLWVLLGIVYTLLVAAFGYGTWKQVGANQPLRITGGLLFAYGITGLFWPFAPMHQRQVIAAGGGTLSDTLHIVFSIATVLLMLFAMGFGAKAWGKWFRLYSIVTIILLLVLGTWTSKEGAKLDANLPTPWLGLVERVLIGLFLLWVVILAIKLLQAQKDFYTSVTKLNKGDSHAAVHQSLVPGFGNNHLKY
jgi:hypothetical protein